MNIIIRDALQLVEACHLSCVCTIKGCTNPIFAVLIFNEDEIKDTHVRSYPICQEHYLQGAKLKNVIWDSEER